MRAVLTTALLTTAALLGCLAPAQAAPELAAAELDDLRALAVGESAQTTRLPLGKDREGPVALKRVDVYAPDARILVPTDDGLQEVPRSDWLHFLVDRAAYAEGEFVPRLALSMSPDGREVAGVLLSDDGGTYALSSTPRGGALRLALRDSGQDLNGTPTDFRCRNDAFRDAARFAWQDLVGEVDPAAVMEVTAGSRRAVVAIDTDNEFMNLKFSNNTTNATNYLAQLFVQFNVVYERDLDLTLQQGTTLLRVSTTPDPYVENGVNAGNQLDEFGEEWAANQSGVSRAFAMLLSGKSSSPNSASGIAWVLGNVNYCNQRNVTFPGCGDGTCTSGHYSASQVFRFAGATAANDLLVLAHELGHNFGANHTHCSNASTGVGITSTNTIDTCFNGEAAQGCYSGAISCPVPGTVNGVTNVSGTLMSYCHLSGLAGCNSSTVFATAHRTLINPRVANNVTMGCFTNATAINQAPTLNAIADPAAILEDAGQQTVNLSGIGDGDGNTQTLTVTASSANTALIPTPTVTYTSPNSTGQIRYTPVANASGSAVITVTVSDNGGTTGGGVNTFSRTFTVNVTAVNDPPTLNAVSHPTIGVNATQQTVNLSGISAGPGESQTLTVSASSSNTGLIPTPTVVYTSPNATGQIRYTPVAGQSGTATITVTVTDNGGVANGGQNSVSRSYPQVVSNDMIFQSGFE